ncbi:MAG TPA: glycosyltransferase [Herpetosiphon sp.]|uniref:Glycosyltransferase, MGT family n=1 Tax=Herpetosiphon aurantiacus (strain ATCC 23779 / DSM 785 / 114-95) TaxID=316274 RepID=A9AUK2_HERA2|nr:glycosyltransferase [Herpetosiphon sp.]ABX04529.1 glycosyltransferase, MGT family [Herpetosiphon aurantiacus DSM 785]HBW50000.1 glycosyltransferase [Herpetosiphon sp.]
MRVLFTTNPGVGHLNPMLPLAHALQQAGHSLAFASAAAFGPTIEAHGFRCFAAGLDWLQSQLEHYFPETSTMSLEELSAWFISDLFADLAAQYMVPDLLAICHEWQPDLIVRNDFEFGGYIAAECLGIPHATLSISFFLPIATLEPLIGDQLAFLRSSHGLAPYPALDRLYHYAYLASGPLRCQEQIIPTMHAIQPQTMIKQSANQLPTWVTQLGDRPTVYASMGTVFNRTADIFPTILAALRDEPINLILTIGRNQDPAQFGPQPAHIHIEQFIPQDLLFPYCDLFITHTSFHTMMSAFKCGLPLLMLPISADEPVCALRGLELGIGRIIKRPKQFDQFFDDSIPELSPTAVRTAVHELLHNPSYRQNAQQLQAEIRALPELESAVALLTKLAAEKQPQRAH